MASKNAFQCYPSNPTLHCRCTSMPFGSSGSSRSLGSQHPHDRPRFVQIEARCKELLQGPVQLANHSPALMRTRPGGGGGLGMNPGGEPKFDPSRVARVGPQGPEGPILRSTSYQPRCPPYDFCSLRKHSTGGPPLSFSFSVRC